MSEEPTRKPPGPKPMGIKSRNYRVFVDKADEFKIAAAGLGMSASALLRGIMDRIDRPEDLARFITPGSGA